MRVILLLKSTVWMSSGTGSLDGGTWARESKDEWDTRVSWPCHLMGLKLRQHPHPPGAHYVLNLKVSLTSKAQFGTSVWCYI